MPPDGARTRVVAARVPDASARQDALPGLMPRGLERRREAQPTAQGPRRTIGNLDQR
jgi:hypothetical protein